MRRVGEVKLALLPSVLLGLSSVFGPQSVRFAPLHSAVMPMRLFVVVGARAAEEEQNRLGVFAHGWFPTTINTRVSYGSVERCEPRVAKLGKNFVRGSAKTATRSDTSAFNNSSAIFWLLSFGIIKIATPITVGIPFAPAGKGLLNTFQCAAFRADSMSAAKIPASPSPRYQVMSARSPANRESVCAINACCFESRPRCVVLDFSWLGANGVVVVPFSRAGAWSSAFVVATPVTSSIPKENNKVFNLLFSINKPGSPLIADYVQSQYNAALGLRDNLILREPPIWTNPRASLFFLSGAYLRPSLYALPKLGCGLK